MEDLNLDLRGRFKVENKYIRNGENADWQAQLFSI